VHNYLVTGIQSDFFFKLFPILFFPIFYIFQPTTDRYSFTVTGDVDGVDPAILGTPAVSLQTCTTDYVIIPAPNDGTVNLPSDRFCGLGIPTTVISTTTPFVLYSVTDANENLDISNRGFYLTYSQNTCPV
jgi:hypothetical protein